MAQEQTAKMSQPLTDGRVRPNDKVTVYATDKSRFFKPGSPHQVHRALADKLIAQGKATKDAPAAAAPAPKK